MVVVLGVGCGVATASIESPDGILGSFEVVGIEENYTIHGNADGASGERIILVAGCHGHSAGVWLGIEGKMPGRMHFLNVVWVAVEGSPDVREKGRGMVWDVLRINDEVLFGKADDDVVGEESRRFHEFAGRIVESVLKPGSGVVDEGGLESVAQIEKPVHIGVIKLIGKASWQVRGIVVPSPSERNECLQSGLTGGALPRTKVIGRGDGFQVKFVDPEF